ncbi:hypothetical protein Tco_0451556 [Tanacetum coccineum]
MDWLSKRKFVIVCYEKVVRIPLEGDEIFRVHGERTLGAAKALMNTKLKEEHEVHLKLVLESLRKEKLYAKFSKYNSKEWNSGDDQLRLRWMIYLVVLADAAESVRDAIGFEYCLASSSGWTKSPVLWAEIGGSSLIGPELVQETTDKVVLVKEKPKAARDRQKSYVDFRRKPLEFEVGDRLFEILERIGLVAYRLRLPEELNSMHDTFHVSISKKCLADANLHVPLNEIKIDKTFRGLRLLNQLVKSQEEISIRREYCDNHDLSRVVLLPISVCFDRRVTGLPMTFSLLLTPLCCDDIHDVTPRVSAKAGCDRMRAMLSSDEEIFVWTLLRRK